MCEKPDAARRIGQALGHASDLGPPGIPVLDVRSGSKRFIVCSGSGHLFGLTGFAGYSGIFPVFDLEWVVSKSNPRAKRIIKVISQYAKDATSFVNACDYDQEGEVIGYTILEFACGARYGSCMRAKFSTLTDEEIKLAFESLEDPNQKFAEAGRSRHMLDFIYGVNLSRALVASFKSSKSGYRNLSIGRVQGPTLAFATGREREIKLHVPDPYWTIEAEYETIPQPLAAHYKEPKIATLSIAERIEAECKGKNGTVTKVLDRETVLRPPIPFSLGDLQKEAYRLFRINPSYTLALAEKLYLSAMISYPRTSSQKLPPSIGYRKIVSGLQRSSAYARLSSMLLSRARLEPNEGTGSDPAHPAIFPTGQISRNLSGIEFKVFDLIVKRFLATFGEYALIKDRIVSISVGDHEFIAEGRSTTFEGWMVFYKPYIAQHHSLASELREGDLLKNNYVRMEEKFSVSPYRYSQASLLSKMEQEGIGTKSTRADIITTMLKRRYLSDNRGLIESTDLGLSVIESMRKYVPDIVSTELTKLMEESLEKIERGSTNSTEVIENSIERLVASLALFRQKKIEIGSRIWRASQSTSAKYAAIGSCPICKTGMLMVIRSRASKKRFVGCSNYASGCRASAPLPQKGLALPDETTCRGCEWPKLRIKFARRAKPWVICPNLQCPLRRDES